MRLQYEPRFSIPINGIEYTVGLASKDAFMETVSENVTEAITDGRAGLIVLVDTIPDKRRPAVFWHEFIHAAFGEVGYDFYADTVGCDKDESRESQERLACFLGPVLQSTMAGPKAIYDMLKGPIGGRLAKRRAKGSRDRPTRPTAEGEHSSQAGVERRRSKGPRV